MKVPPLVIDVTYARGRRKRDLWTQDHERERLTQLQLDVDSALERFGQQCQQMANQAPAQAREEWQQRAELVEEIRGLFLRDCKRFLECTEQKEAPPA